MRFAKLKLAILCVTAGLAFQGKGARAGDAYYLTPGVGTLGGSIKGGYRWSENMGASGIVSGFMYSRNVTYAGVPGNARTQLFGAGFILDYYPVGGDLRVSGGLRYSNDKVTGTVTQSGTTVGFTAEANTLQPYLGLGYSLPVSRNMALDLDVGAYYMGKTTVTPDRAFNNAAISGALSQASADFNKTNFYPVAQLGLRFEF
ncbi:TonB-dependent receptor [Rhizobium sp. C4]|uniref:TonB-dependent receptor n=1 Tax=Rhizobium sp. C4 TaxID=1349800 RepID=UPI001E4CAE80|nr:TonB-dependent receptor [Rhizobium sp. C4]MCD2174726.1 TonB-dependent receptor [Rhizobium sp. C4]